ncbi:glycoside hydrolase family 5 protein [Botryobasidium botryosum FD-172 SS1]|uniref:Glycoside hydrolase family 5 protein n=1 Tax=Botryobasidium botryosum (strain FD-172 SS1) TaxID=930990 RepID=A0A067LSY3_BOTB1|nr:glycoside hydrolase family 5 protein [Botryobasidium botryosum FD-172 SS1]
MRVVLPALVVLVSAALAAGQPKCRLVKAAAAAHSPPTPAHSPSPSPFPSPSPTTTLTTPQPPSATGPPPPPFDYNNTKVRGVNLGGWFVLEPWITPSIFDGTGNPGIVDEFTFGQMQDTTVATSTLQKHWSTWIVEDDFRQISAAGLTHVRIPIGYWSIPSSISPAPFITGAWPYLLQSIAWARKYNLYVIVDLHGAPGSQNGYDNSGQRLDQPTWAATPSNIQRTVDAITMMAQEFSKPEYKNVLSSIELLNEPAGFNSSILQAIRPYWTEGYNAVRALSQDIVVTIGDAFMGVSFWNGFLVPPSAANVLMDTHVYQVFSDDQLSLTNDQHISAACAVGPSLGSYSSRNLWTIVGEWSASPTDCATYLNGRGRPARWSSDLGKSCQGLTGDSTNFSASYKSFLRSYWEAQVTSYEKVNGWIYWTWKTESADEWSYQKGLEGGWIPQDPTQRLNGSICS